MTPAQAMRLLCQQRSTTCVRPGRGRRRAACARLRSWASLGQGEVLNAAAVAGKPVWFRNRAQPLGSLDGSRVERCVQGLAHPLQPVHAPHSGQHVRRVRALPAPLSQQSERLCPLQQGVKQQQFQPTPNQPGAELARARCGQSPRRSAPGRARTSNRAGLVLSPLPDGSAALP